MTKSSWVNNDRCMDKSCEALKGRTWSVPCPVCGILGVHHVVERWVDTTEPSRIVWYKPLTWFMSPTGTGYWERKK